MHVSLLFWFIPTKFQQNLPKLCIWLRMTLNDLIASVSDLTMTLTLNDHEFSPFPLETKIYKLTFLSHSSGDKNTGLSYSLWVPGVLDKTVFNGSWYYLDSIIFAHKIQEMFTSFSTICSLNLQTIYNWQKDWHFYCTPLGSKKHCHTCNWYVFIPRSKYLLAKSRIEIFGDVVLFVTGLMFAKYHHGVWISL